MSPSDVQFDPRTPGQRRPFPSTVKHRSVRRAAIQLPVLIWVACTYLLASQMFELGAVPALGVAAACGYVIYLIERVVLLARMHWAMVVARFVLTLAIAVIGGGVVDAIIFHGDIVVRLVELAQVQQQQESAVKIRRQEIVVERSKADWDESLRKLDAEIDGTGGSGHKGCAAICQQLKRQADDKHADYVAARAALAAVLERADHDRAALQGPDAVPPPAGLLGRLEALHDVLRASFAARVFWWALTVFVMLAESSALLAKLTGGDTLEERLDALHETVVYDIARRRQRARLAPATLGGPATRPVSMRAVHGPVREQQDV